MPTVTTYRLLRDGLPPLDVVGEVAIERHYRHPSSFFDDVRGRSRRHIIMVVQCGESPVLHIGYATNHPSEMGHALTFEPSDYNGVVACLNTYGAGLAARLATSGHSAAAITAIVKGYKEAMDGVLMLPLMRFRVLGA